MSITVNIYYKGENGSARKFAEEMISSGTVEAFYQSLLEKALTPQNDQSRRLS